MRAVCCLGTARGQTKRWAADIHGRSASRFSAAFNRLGNRRLDKLCRLRQHVVRKDLSLAWSRLATKQEHEDPMKGSSSREHRERMHEKSSEIEHRADH